MEDTGPYQLMQSIPVYSTGATHSFLSGQNHVPHLSLTFWRKWKRDVETKRFGWTVHPFRAHSSWAPLLRTTHPTLYLHIFSCWENCFHITEAAADKYRKLVIGTGIITKVRKRWIWGSVKEINPTSNSPVLCQGQRVTKHEKIKSQEQPSPLHPQPFIFDTRSEVKPTTTYTPGSTCLSFCPKAINIPGNRDPACLLW